MTKLAASYVGKNEIVSKELPSLIQSCHQALARFEGGEQSLEPAVPIAKSIKLNEIICVECGNGFRTLKRHLLSGHGMTAEEYRERWGLERDYPLVAPNYAKQRSEFAKKIGLGRKPRAGGPKARGKSWAERSKAQRKSRPVRTKVRRQARPKNRCPNRI